MSDAPLIARIAHAIQVHHESTLALQELAAELVDHCERMRGFTDRLHVVVQQYEAPQPVDVLRMPRVLQGGPTVREA